MTTHSAFRRVAAFVLASFLAAFAIQPASAQLSIRIEEGNLEPLPIAIPDFVGATPQEATIGRDVAQVIASNLDRSGLVRPLDQRSYIEKVTDINVAPRFGDWRIVQAQALVTGQVAVQADGRLRADFRLWDVFGESQMVGLQFFTTPDNWRRVAHLISDAIYERLTGEKGYFDTRIVFIAESGPRDNRRKRLAIMDQDGANPQFLTDGSYIVLTPRFNPTANSITYMSYQGGQPRVYLFNLDTGQQELLGNFPNMTYAPRFSPDGASVIFSMEQAGNSDIFTMDLRTRRANRLTNDPSIDTSPSFSPDGTQIVFNSDRGGSQQIYLMNADGSNVRRISFGEGTYGTPVWSPRGDLIAFTKMRGGRFYIGVMRTDGSGERLLTESWLDEGPTWSPNGRVLVFFRGSPAGRGGSGGGSKLMSVDLTGQNLRDIVTPTDASDPAWSPLIR